MTHVDEDLVAPIVARFGAPAEWDTRREITARDAATIRAPGDPTRRHDVTFAILAGDGRIVVIRKPQYPAGAWRIPSGGIRPGEAFAEGTAREAFEETGLEIELTGYPLVVRAAFTHRGHADRWTTHVVTARAAGGALDPRDIGEIDAARWMTLAELTGPVADVLRATPARLFHYRADLHDRVRPLIEGGAARTLEG